VDFLNAISDPMSNPGPLGEVGDSGPLKTKTSRLKIKLSIPTRKHTYRAGGNFCDLSTTDS
jgi:hypothetical protein